MPISVPTLGLRFGWGRSHSRFSSRNLESQSRRASRLLRVARLIRYLAYDAHAADLLFQVVSRRYEQKSIVITTNLPFKQ